MSPDFETLINALGKRVISFGGPLTTVMHGATSDSRQVQPGMLFCAMKGARLDGHDFIDSAVSRGAGAVLMEKCHDLPEGMPWIQVVEPYQAFGIVAELFAGKPAENLDILAVTGTNGKTTTACLLREIWRKAGRNTGMIGTVEYDLCGDKPVQADRTTPTPFELQQLFAVLKSNGGDSAAMEFSSHALEQRRPGTMKCAAAVFTNLTQDHLDYHVTMENYYQAKKLLFTDFLRDGAPAIVNCDDEWGARLASELRERCNVAAYSFLKDDCKYRFSIRSMNASGTEMEMRCGEEVFVLTTPLVGSYNAYNAAGAAVCAHVMGIPGFGEALAVCKGAPGRLEAVPGAGRKFSVFVDYAHTDDALRNVLGTLRKLKGDGGRLISVFGCGGDRDRTKRPLMAQAAAEISDMVFVTSDNPRTENPEDIISDILAGMPDGANFRAVMDRASAIEAAIRSAGEGDIVLIAGKGHEDYQEINGVKHPFDDRIIAAEIMDSL